MCVGMCVHACARALVRAAAGLHPPYTVYLHLEFTLGFPPGGSVPQVSEVDQQV